jgi:hypothetical protein
MKRTLAAIITLLMLASATTLGGVSVSQAKTTQSVEDSIRAGDPSPVERMCLWVWIGPYKFCT